MANPRPMITPAVLYLHGFASSPASTKAVFFRDAFARHGMQVRSPDLNAGDFPHPTVSRMLEQPRLEAAGFDRKQPLIVVASSLGGYAAALHAAAGGRADALVLLAPAFDPVGRWTSLLGPERLARWCSEEYMEFHHHAEGRPLPLHCNFYHDVVTHAPWPCPGERPVLVLAGIHDEIVPVDTSREFVRRCGFARLREVDTDHEMRNALPRLWEHTTEFLSEHGLLASGPQEPAIASSGE